MDDFDESVHSTNVSDDDEYHDKDEDHYDISADEGGFGSGTITDGPESDPREYDDRLNYFGEDQENNENLAVISALDTSVPATIRARLFARPTSLQSIAHHNLCIKPGSSVRLDDGDYLRIIKISGVGVSSTTLHGLRLRPNRSMQGLVPNTRGDLTLLVYTHGCSQAPLYKQALCKVNLGDVRALCRVSLVAERAIPNPAQSPSVSRSIPKHTLICCVVCITYSEIPRKDRLRSAAIRALKSQGADEPWDQLPQSKQESPRLDKTKVYTIGDICHGPGGATEGAKRAGFKSKWAVDYNELCDETFKLNNPGEDVFLEDLNSFIHWCQRLHADLIHASTPCPPWSIANTSPVIDPTNKKLLFMIPKLITKMSPRQMVIEQVDGLIILSKNRPGFAKLIRGIIDKGYNASWQIIDFRSFGSCQRRKRLIILVSA
jgi:hypothetical protein